MKKKTFWIIVIVGILALGFIVYYLIGDNELFYSCPKKGEYMESEGYKWIDCMPIIDGESSKYCDSNYRNWIQTNCNGIIFTD